VLDLFAGSGAGGIEALSRGAVACWFVERDASAIRVIADNLERAGLAGPAAIVVRADAIEWLSRMAAVLAPIDIVLVDPPYAEPDLLVGALRRLGDPAAPALLADDGVVVAKHFWRAGPPAVIGLLASVRVRRFGETALTFYRRQPTGGEDR
jgi:16S rRNA (guanine(966)-N(2))-methyltransferase RsmD